LKAFTPSTISTSASPTATVSAATLIVRGPCRHGADGRQRRTDKVDRHQAAEHIPQDRGAGAHDEHGVDEQQPAAAVDGPALLHQESDGAKNNREPARGNVDW
jgi:hypothetical protein